MRFLNSVKSLYAAVGILLLTFCIGIYMDGRNKAMHVRHLEINTGLEKMVRLNQELAGMLMIAVLERNSLRAASYDTVNSDLEETIKTVAHLIKMQDMRMDISALSEGRIKLHALEVKVIRLMSADKWEEAKGVLFGNEYVLIKKTYEIDSETEVGAVTGELAETAQRFDRIRKVTGGMEIGALLLLLWIGVMFSRRMQADLSEQIHLKNELAVAYEAMEDRVLERTADLQQTTNQLALENEERLRSEERTLLILNSAAEGIFGVDAEERVTFINQAAERLLGYRSEEIIGREIHDLIHHSHADGSPYPREDCLMFQACRRGERTSGADEVLWRKDGSSFLSEYSVTPFLDQTGATSGAVVVIRDISLRRESEAALRRNMEDLERFNRLTMDREERMIQLKQEINALLAEMGREKKYKAVEDE
jgi:PAS domain S-box-containing protein